LLERSKEGAYFDQGPIKRSTNEISSQNQLTIKKIVHLTYIPWPFPLNLRCETITQVWYSWQTTSWMEVISKVPTHHQEHSCTLLHRGHGLLYTEPSCYPLCFKRTDRTFHVSFHSYCGNCSWYQQRAHPCHRATLQRMCSRLINTCMSRHQASPWGSPCRTFFFGPTECTIGSNATYWGNPRREPTLIKVHGKKPKWGFILKSISNIRSISLDLYTMIFPFKLLM